MFIYFFGCSVILLMLTLLVSAFMKRHKKIMGSLILLFTCTTVLFSFAMVLERFYSNQFTFLQPGYLALLVLPIGLLVGRIFWTEKFTQALAYPLADLLKQPASLTTFFSRWLESACTIVALILFVIALARPVTVNKTKLPPTQGIDIMMIIDASASMNKSDFYPTRFVAAQKNAIRFIGKRFNDRIGLTVFAKNATLASPLTLDHEAVQELVSSLYLGIVDPNLTAIGDALGVAANHLKNSDAKSKIIVLLTDGSNNAGALDPLLAAKAPATYGIKIYTIATASTPGESI